MLALALSLLWCFVFGYAVGTIGAWRNWSLPLTLLVSMLLWFPQWFILHEWGGL